jgi:hypothetical protein
MLQYKGGTEVIMINAGMLEMLVKDRQAELQRKAAANRLRAESSRSR